MPTKKAGPVFKALLERDEAKTAGEKKETMTIAAGCFWGVELAFQRVPGVLKTSVGCASFASVWGTLHTSHMPTRSDTGGHVKDPTYKQVCSGESGHAEAVQIEFDPTIVTYEELLSLFWERHDATTLNRQGNDVGSQYRSAIFYHSEAQQKAAEASRDGHSAAIIEKVVTEVSAATTFYPAEDYHQQYLEKGGQSADKGDLSDIRCYG